MLTVGITGGIGSGKSTVAKIFAVFDIAIYESDKRAKQLMQSKSVRANVVDLLGSKSYINDKLNRAWIAKQVFNSPELLKRLNDIVHPAVANDFDEWKNRQNGPYILQESALAFETGIYLKLDAIITVHAPEQTRIKRVMARDNVSEQKVLDRMNAQWPQQEKILHADYSINNDGLTELIPQVLNLHRRLVHLNAHLATFTA